jgi:hypothetical protein
MKKHMNRRKSNGYWERIILSGLRAHLRRTQPFQSASMPKDLTTGRKKAA